MFLTEITLRNWRSYRSAVFRLPAPTAKNYKNVILIGAQNGVGKTSLLMALYLGLFGREAMHLIEGFRLSPRDDERSRSYHKLVERLLHRPARSSPSPFASVKLTFEGEIGKVTVTRKWHYRRNGKPRDLNSRDGEEILVEAGSQIKAYDDWEEANNALAELFFPSNVMPSFFFDGEQAQERVEAAGGYALLDAVNTLYGTGILDQLDRSLQTYIANTSESLRRDVGSVKEDELAKKRREYDQLKEEIDHTSDQLIAAQRALDALEKERDHKNEELYQIVGDSSADIGEQSDRIRMLEQRERQLSDSLCDGLVSLAVPLARGRLARKLTSELEAETKRERWLLLKDEASKKADSIMNAVFPEAGGDLDPPLHLGQEAQLKARLKGALEQLWEPPPEGCATEFRYPFLSEADRNSVLKKLNSVAAASDVAGIVTEWNSVAAELREARRKWDDIRDIEPKLNSLKADLGDLNERIREKNGQVSTLEYKERGLRAKAQDLKAAIRQMEQKQTLADPVREKLDVAYRVRAAIEDSKERLIPLCRTSLEDRCTFHFSQMISDEYRRHRVSFDEESEPRLEVGDETPIYVSSLSGAQKRAFGLAFTLAIADISGQAAPIVIDTPVGNMDSKYRYRVLRHVAENAPGQVIFLSHDEEISSTYEKQLDHKIIKKFLVEFAPVEDGAGISTVHEDKYFA